VFVIVAAMGCMLVLASCDNGSPNPGTEASPTDTDAFSELLTQLPSLPTATPAPTPKGLDDNDRVNIYLDMIDTLLGEKIPAYIYISPYLGQGERLDEPDENQPIPHGLLPALEKGDTGPKYQVSEFKDAIGPLEEGGAVKNKGAFITLGAVTGDASDKDAVVVRGSIYRKEGDAEGDRFRFKRDASAPHGWKLLDVTQEWTEKTTSKP
jgi:hypothetical protein